MMKKYINKEIVLYGVFGILTSVLNIGLFTLLYWLGLKYFIANLITLVIVKIIAYLCNKFFVFKKRCSSTKELLLEIAQFIYWRSFTLLIDYFGLIVLVEFISVPKIISKIIVTLTVVIINYITGKKWIFKKQK